METGQTRVKAGHIELVQGSKYTKNVKRMLWICARDKRRSNRSKSVFFPLGHSCFCKVLLLLCSYLFSSQENNSKQSVAHILKRNCFNYLGIIYCCAISPSLKSLSLALKAINRIQIRWNFQLALWTSWNHYTQV